MLLSDQSLGTRSRPAGPKHASPSGLVQFCIFKYRGGRLTAARLEFGGNNE